MFVTSKRGFKAQFTMKVLLEIFLLLVVYSTLYPAFMGNEDSWLNTLIIDFQESDPITASLLRLLPFVIAAVIIIGVLSFNMIYSRRK